VAEREVPADHRHGEQAARPRDPVQDALGVLAVGAHEHVHDRQRTRAHRAHVGDVGHHRGRSGAVRVGAQERRRDRLAADDEVRAVVRHERRVVAVDPGGEPLDHADITLAEQPWRRPDALCQRLEVGHRRD
jgi:hypothetical protein